jgi:hypothetical protein
MTTAEIPRREERAASPGAIRRGKALLLAVKDRARECWGRARIVGRGRAQEDRSRRGGDCARVLEGGPEADALEPNCDEVASGSELSRAIENGEPFPSAAELFQTARELATDGGSPSERLLRVECSAPFGEGVFGATRGPEHTSQEIAAIWLEPDGPRLGRAELSLGGGEVLSTLVVGGEKERNPSIPGALARASSDLGEDCLRLPALPLLEEVGRPRELRVEVRGDRSNRDVRARDGRNQEADEEGPSERAAEHP